MRFTSLAVRHGLSVTVLMWLALSGCSTLHLPASSTASASADQSTTARLAALETGLQQLARRVDTLQVYLDEARPEVRSAARQELPLEQQPLRPELVLAVHTPATPPAPSTAPSEPVRQPVEPVPAAPVPAAPVTPPPRQGDWVINLASYSNPSYAARKQSEFADAGVPVEQVEATVNGKTIYRLCVSGFTTSLAARREAGSIRAKLGLQDTWIARR